MAKTEGRTLDLDDAPVVLHGPRWISPMMAAAGVVAMIVGVVVWRQTQSLLIGGIVLAVGVWTFGLGLVTRRMSISLTLAPGGLKYVSLGVRRSWRWQDIDGFEAGHVKSGRLINFRDYTKDPKGRPFSLPAQWDTPREEVIRLLRAARERWGR